MRMMMDEEEEGSVRSEVEVESERTKRNSHVRLNKVAPSLSFLLLFVFASAPSLFNFF